MNFKNKAKKSLGQNFLKSEKALRQIIEASQLTKDDIVLEIGPGRGALTRKILESEARVIAVEKDEVLAEELRAVLKSFCDTKQLEIITGDALIFEPSTHKNLKKKYKLIANIPYYITGALIEKYLTEKNPPELATLLVQKEVAERIVSRDKKESILSIAVKVFGDPKYIATVPSGAFNPAPNVDSAIINISNISNKIFNDKKSKLTEKRFFEVVKAGFAHKRKQLGRNLENIVSSEKFTKCNIDTQRRAETLNKNDWICLAEN